MRPPRVQRSTLEYPLDSMLGSSALVRLLRVLVHDVGGPVGVADAARMAGLSTTGARKALETLVSLGVAVRVGTGRARKYGPRDDSPFSAVLGQLFEQEQLEYADLTQDLQQAVAMPEVHDAWMRDLPSDSRRTLELGVTTDSKALSWIGPELRTRLTPTEKRFDLIVEVNVFTRAGQPEHA